MSDKLLLIDSNSLIHRAYHALPNLKSSKGMYTGAIFGFLNLFLRIVKEQRPTHVAAAFDLRAPTFRHSMYPGYKATRKPMDNELAAQIEPLKQLLGLMGIAVVEMEGYEADDILGTLSKRFSAPTIILTGDRDSFQLISDTTRVFWTRKGVSDVEVYDLQRLAADGFTPESFVDYKALRGDPSDNIPGVAGVGEKTAKQLLETYKTLDEVLNHAFEVRGKVGETLAAQRETAYLSRRLARIDTAVPLDVTPDRLRFEPVFGAEVKRRLQELEINSLIPRMEFSEEAEVAPRRAEKTVTALTSADGVTLATAGAEEMALLIGTDVSFATSPRVEYSIGCAEDLFSAGMDFESAVAAVRDAVREKRAVCYDYKSLGRKYGIQAKEFFDVMIAAHLLRGSAPIKSIETVLGGEGMEVGAAELMAFAREAERQLSERGMDKLFFEVEQPLAVVLRNMEERGFCVDSERLGGLGVKYGEKVKDLTEEIFDLAGGSFNIASPKQLGEVLFDRLGLKHGKKTKTGYSVGEDVLSGLASEHPIASKVLQWRHFAKLVGTYVSGMRPLVTRGRIHTEFNQCITTTGRLSSTNPNLQNLPTRGEEARDIKSAFVASPGCVLVSADYSQIELRLLAHFSGDRKLIEAYCRSDDIHAHTAAQILGVSEEEVTPAQRREAKAVNFGIIYGMSDFGLAENLSIPKYKAREFIDRYFETYPAVRAYLTGAVAAAKEKGYAETLLGRRRNLPELQSSVYLLRSSAERMAMNTPLQGSAADIVKLAMLAVEKRLSGMKSRLIMQVHDELIVDAVKEEAEEVATILSQEMENVVSLEVPLIAESCTAENWGDLK